MRVFVFEYITGGGCAGAPIIASLMAEGDLMLSAVVRDLLGIDGVEVTLCRDRRLELPELPIRVRQVGDDWHAAWRRCLAEADAVWPIAPETGGVLERLCREVEESGRLLLNSSADAVAIATGKQRTLQRLAEAGIPVVPSRRGDAPPPRDWGPLVVKPDQGVGCQGIRLLPDATAVQRFLTTRADPGNWLVQPYVAGSPASLSLMVGRDCVCLLGANRQRLAQVDDGLMLLGCVVNGLEADRRLLASLGQRIGEAIPGLFGYVGVDLILTESGPVVLEINPRLTTSYVGLSRSTGSNTADLMLKLAADPSDLPAAGLTGTCVHIDLELQQVA